MVNTGTTVLTFLAVFLIQNSQNRDGAAIQAKLDEILRSGADARSGFVGIEHLTDVQIAQIKAALEREVLEVSQGEPDQPAPTVEELLEACRDPAVDAPASVPQVVRLPVSNRSQQSAKRSKRNPRRSGG